VASTAHAAASLRQGATAAALHPATQVTYSGVTYPSGNTAGVGVGVGVGSEHPPTHVASHANTFGTVTDVIVCSLLKHTPHSQYLLVSLKAVGYKPHLPLSLIAVSAKISALNLANSVRLTAVASANAVDLHARTQVN